jgi:hypothetical protein
MRQSIKLIAVSLPLLVVAACSDVSTSPQSSATRSLSAAPAFDYSGGGRYRFGDMRTSFTVTPDGGSFAINSFLNVDFPAGSICDPTRSSYGPGEWDNDCVVLTRAITITATTRLTNQGVAVDFQPELRFSPSKVVTLSTDLFATTLQSYRSYFRASPSSTRSLAFYYAPSLGADPVADYLTDASLVTQVDLETGHVWRRVKHFSGYVGTSGGACNPSAGDPDCVAVHTETTP